MRTRVLTGITTTGTPHLGNYVGAIRPAVTASRREDVDSFYFMADYHALIKARDAARVQRSRLQISATWLAAGLDPDKTTFYRQSDIPEIPELMWLLTCVTAKGLLNRAHAYKAAVDNNNDEGDDPDAGITAGLYMYPVLMAADILAFNANQVPVGRDQIQHIEMARDIAQRFNHLYGGDFFTLPEVLIEEDVATLPGLDGRKMSKSYDNTIPLFEGGAKATRAAVMRIITDSREPGEPKDPDHSALFTIYRAFAGEEASRTFADELRDGLGWGDAKKRLVACLEDELEPMRARYADLMAHPDDIEDTLRAGAAKARKLATPMLEKLQQVVGLGNAQPVSRSHQKPKRARRARAVSFRDPDGNFRFRLLAANGDELALSKPFEDPRAAGQCMQHLIDHGTDVHIREDGDNLQLLVDDLLVASTPNYPDAEARQTARQRLQTELATAGDD